MIIAPLTEQHYPIVKQIYEQGLATGNSTFQTSAPDWKEWDSSHIANCRLVGIENDQVVGWAALTPVSGRCVYAGVAEVSVYVDESFRGKGFGTTLLEALIQESEKNNLWTLQAGIFPENVPSISIHEALGFRQVGYREKIGQLRGVWRDTVLLERRSNKVGI
jgi:L-amino acid N-acyltransferase YncA